MESAAETESAAPHAKLDWHADLQNQIQAVRALLAVAPLNAENLAARFKRKPLKGVAQVLAALEALGMAEKDGEGRWRG